MRRFKGFGRTALIMVCAVALGVAFVAVSSNAYAGDNIPSKVGLMKPLKLWKLVSKPTTPPALPDCTPGNSPVDLGGTLTVTMGTDTLSCTLPAADWDAKDTGGWKLLGKCEPGKAKGWKYLNKGANDGTPGADDGNPCKVIIVKEKVVKILAKGSGGLPNPLASGNPATSIALTAGDGDYCAEWTSYATEKEDKLVKVKDAPAPTGECGTTPTCDCTGATRLGFVTGIPSGQPAAGTLSNYRCSNAPSSACAGDGDCDFGTCTIPPGICSENFGIACTGDGDCLGTCAEVVAGNLPLALEVGSLYTGGGLNSVPLPLPVPDQGEAYTNVTTGDGQTLTLSATTPAQVGDRHCTKGRTCLDGTTPCVLDADCPSTCVDNCVYGPPLPIPNSSNAPTSVCSVNVVAEDASGTAQCDGGDSDLTVALRSVVYLNGDLFKASTPPDIPGIQPCPLCDTLCQGGSKADFPCDDDSECPGSTCGTSTVCLGGPNDGDPCTPETSDSTALGDPENSYPTSQDCQNEPSADITSNIGGLPVNLVMTTGSQTMTAVDRAAGNRNFCGFCRDVDVEGTLCFQGDTNPGCPGGAGDGNAVPCVDNGGCSAPFESCVQRSPGAYSEAASTRIEVNGSTDGGCLGDLGTHTGTLVSVFCIPPTFDPTVDGAGDLPGPGGVLLYGDAQLQ